MRQRTGTRSAVRQAVEYDLVELLRLRVLLFDELAGDFFDAASDDGSWLDALAVVLKEQLDADDVRVLVVDGGGEGECGGDGEGADCGEGGRDGKGADYGEGGEGGVGGLAACAIGTIEQRLPGPHLHNGRIGHVIGVVTDPAHRRRGHSRAIMTALLDWFREREVARVDLHASAEGEPLYRALGFTDHPDPALYWRPC